MSGSHDTTPYIPPSEGSLAYISPIVRDTDNRPGHTRHGPNSNYPLEFATENLV
jgi:hypothetical protein